MVWGWECLSLQRPSQQAMQELVDSTSSGAFNHPYAGATEHAPPLLPGPVADGWILDHNRTQVGAGRRHFEAAKHMLKSWRHMDLGWVQTNQPVVRKGEKVCVSARSLFLWNRLPLEVVYSRSECRLLPWQLGRFPTHRRLTTADLRSAHAFTKQGPVERFVFATATTQGHQLMGEERFAVEWQKADDSVWYEIYTISKPATPLAQLTYPLVRLHQRHFGRQSLRKMAANVLETC